MRDVVERQTFIDSLSDNLRDSFLRFEQKGTTPDPSESTTFLGKLNLALGQGDTYDGALAYNIERFRNRLECAANDTPYVLPNRRSVFFSVICYRLQFLDPANGTFALHCEVSCGTPLKCAAEFVRGAGLGLELDEDSAKAAGLCGRPLCFAKPEVADQLSALLKVRVLNGEIEEWYHYFRYGSASGNIWMVQNFTLKLHQEADFRNLPFDDFTFRCDFSIGMGGDVVFVDLCINDASNPDMAFSQRFTAGEFVLQKRNAKLAAFGFLQDPTCYFENIARLEFRVCRNGTPIFLRIGLPLILMMVMAAGGCLLINDHTRESMLALTTQFLPTLFLSVVALQLTVSQFMPRGAAFSKLDKVFVLSYLFVLVMFVEIALPVTWGWLGILGPLAAYGAALGWFLRPARLSR